MKKLSKQIYEYIIIKKWYERIYSYQKLYEYKPGGTVQKSVSGSVVHSSRFGDT